MGCDQDTTQDTNEPPRTLRRAAGEVWRAALDSAASKAAEARRWAGPLGWTEWQRKGKSKCQRSSAIKRLEPCSPGLAGGMFDGG